MRPGAYRLLTGPDLMGANKDRSQEDLRINCAVKVIQQHLRRRGFSVGARDGVYGQRTHEAAVAYQNEMGREAVGIADGKVGRRTAKALLLPHIRRVQSVYEIPDDILAGMVRHESSYDPGAQGYTTPDDFGLCQINTDVHPYTMEQVLDADFNLDWSARNLLNHKQRYGSWTLAIAAHNSPRKALLWKQTGHAPDEQIANYVTKIREGA